MTWDTKKKQKKNPVSFAALWVLFKYWCTVSIWWPQSWQSIFTVFEAAIKWCARGGERVWMNVFVCTKRTHIVCWHACLPFFFKNETCYIVDVIYINIQIHIVHLYNSQIVYVINYNVLKRSTHTYAYPVILNKYSI